MPSETSSRVRVAFGPRAEPLGPVDLQRARRLGQRIREQLRPLFSPEGPLPNRPSHLARALGIDRATCQRVISAIDRGVSDAEVLARLPGEKGLKQFVEAATRAGVSPEETESLLVTATQIATFVRTVAGSQRQLIARLGHGDERSPALALGADPVACRMALHEIGVSLTGRSSALALNTMIFRMSPGRDDLIEHASVVGQIGHRATPGAMPLGISSFHDAPEESGEHKEPAADRFVLEEFSSSPPPLSSVRQAGRQFVQCIEAGGEVTGDSGVDLVYATRSRAPLRHPGLQGGKMHEVWHDRRFPAERLLFDVLLDRRIAATCVPRASVHLYPHTEISQVGSGWLSEYPDNVGLSVIDARQLGDFGWGGYPRYPELLGDLARRLDWDLSEMVGHRIAVDYPLWRGAYCLSLDSSHGAL